MLILAFVCFFFGWKYYKAVSQFTLQATETTATVTGYQLKNDSSEDGLSFYPQVTFVGPKGNKTSTTLNVSYAKKPDTVGEQLRILYNTKLPQDAREKSFRGLWGAPIVIGGAGLFFLLIGIWCRI